MKFNKIVLGILVSFLISNNLFAKKEVVINFKDLEIKNFIKITSKILNKNILLSSEIKGKVEFVTNDKIYKEDLLSILVYVLESKGHTVVENKNILRIVRLNDASKYNVPVYNKKQNLRDTQIVTEVFNIDFLNVDYMSSKIKHLISKSAKLITDKESNSIILTDFSSNIKTVKTVIEMIAKDRKKDIQNVTLLNIKGSSIIADLKRIAISVFNEKIEKEKVSILLNKNNNSLMFIGIKKNVDFLVKYARNTDKSGSLVERTVSVIGLKNAESKNVIKIINGIIIQKIYKDKHNKPFVSTDDESNSIILMGPKDELDYFTQLIKKLDVDRQQVYVQAKIIEVSENMTRDVGIKYGLNGFSSGGSGLASFSSSLNGGSSIDLSSLSSYGFNLASMKDGLALGMSLNLLNQNGAADIVSEPSLLCINNKESSIYVGQTISIKTGTTTTTAGIPTDSYKREDIGLTLKVKPRISNGNKVLLEINTKLEDVEQTVLTNSNPNTSKKELLTSAIVNNGESIILGGYIRAKKEHTEDKIPFFGDLPLLGSLFRSNREVNDKINLVIIITPYIVPKSKDLSYVREQLSELKLLEDKYTKDTILRLEKAKFKAKENDLKRVKETSILDEEKKDYYEDNGLTEDERLHQKIVNSVLGT